MEFRQIVRHGSITIMGDKLRRHQEVDGSMAMVSRASISSVTFIVPSFRSERDPDLR